MAVFLEEGKVQRSGRISLGTAALRNLDIAEGDFIAIYFDETEGSLIIKKPEPGNSGTPISTKSSHKK
jgi:bifunctional DNA-binding transcriptional regulator/antitoxin component of YhaV-PrlF toxin-antitoxin module